MTPLKSNVSGSSMPPSARAPKSHAHQALAQVLDEVVLELEDAALDAVDQVAEETHRVLDDVADDAGHPGQHVLQHGHELADGVDDRLDGADRLVDEALVLRLQLLDPLVEAPCGTRRTCVASVSTTDSCLELTSLSSCSNCSPISFAASRADLFRSLGRLATYVAISALPSAMRCLAARQVVADDVRDARDDAVHLLEVELAPGLVELVDLVRHPAELVLSPPRPCQSSRCSGPPCRPTSSPRRRSRTSTRAPVSPSSNSFSTLGSMPSRIFFTSASVAAKIAWIFVVTSARFCSSFDLVLPLSATSLASAAPLAPCMPATPACGLGVRFGLALLDDLLLLLRGTPPAPCRRAPRPPSCRRAPAGTRGSFDSVSCASVTSPSAISLVDLVLAGLEVDLLGRRRLGHRPGRRDRHGLRRASPRPSA